VRSAPPRRRRSDHERPAPAFELLESKLLPPQGPAGSVSREALIDVMERATAVPVVFLSAGPGWGKTTLLAEWAARSSRSFAWVSVDDKDNDPIVLLTRTLARRRRAGKGARRALFVSMHLATAAREAARANALLRSPLDRDAARTLRADRYGG
jgi:ATP/maltotriose-dependent transcriptional regulator MalT